MKKALYVFALALLTLSSCKTAERIVYLQDVTQEESVTSAAPKPLKLAPGDKIGVNVSSATTPELALRYNIAASSNVSSSSNYDNLRYTVDENGNVDIVGLGRVKVGGLTRAEAAAMIQSTFRNGIINDAVVTVAAYSRYVTVLGEVAKPGRLEIPRDNINILEALGMAGDLTINGRRDRIKVVRQEGSESKTYFVDLRSKELFSSPVYQLQQNDIIYVEPNRVRMGQSTNNDNSIRQISTWLSVSSLLTSIAILIFRR